MKKLPPSARRRAAKAAADAKLAKPIVAAVRRTSARELALLVVRDVFGPERRGAQAAFDVRSRRAELDARDRNFAAELAYGTIKRRRLIDWYLAPYLASRTGKLPDTIADILRLGAYQVLFMDGVDDHAAVFETVNLALRFGHRGTAGLVNAILRRLLVDRPAAPAPSDFTSDAEYLATEASLPTWILSQWSEAFGEALPRVLAGVNAPAQHALVANPLRDGDAALASRFPDAPTSRFVRGVTILQHGDAVYDDPEGRWLVQNEAAAMPVDLLAVRPGETVVEYASGRGNKSVQLAAALGNEGTLVSVELDPRKVKVWRAVMERCGVTCATVVEGDALVAELPVADAVLVDAPCSGTGTLGRHPEARWRKDPHDGERLAPTQRALLERASRGVRAGGRLVYSVCSSDRREGVEIVRTFLDEHADFARAELPERYADFARDGDAVVPPGIEGRDGFYIAVLRRSGAQAPAG